MMGTMNSQELIRRMMELTGMNAVEFSQATGLTESMISRILNGKNDPSFDKIAAAVERLGFAISFTPVSMPDLERGLLRNSHGDGKSHEPDTIGTSESAAATDQAQPARK